MSKRKREEIIRKAEPIFARYGFKKSTMDNIAENINLKKSTLYYYFKNKEEIFFDVIERECNILKENILEKIKKEKCIKKRLKLFFLVRLGHYKRLAEYYSTFNKEYFETLEIGKNIFTKYFLWEEQIIEEIITKGIKKGVFKKNYISISKVISLLVIILKGFEHQSIVKNDESLDEKISNVLDIIFKGIER